MVERVERGGAVHRPARRGGAGALFTAADRAAVEAAVGAAELRTAAEIVPVVASSSARHRRAEDIAGVWCAFLALAALALFSPEHQIDGLEALVAFIVALAAGTFAAEKIPSLKRLFASRADLSAAAADGALRAFRTFGVGETAGRSGLLLYVSLFERSAVVIGDIALAGVLSAKDYGAIRDVLLEGLKADRLPQSLTAAIGKAGDLLKDKLPRSPDDRPEITNSLRILG